MSFPNQRSIILRRLRASVSIGVVVLLSIQCSGGDAMLNANAVLYTGTCTANADCRKSNSPGLTTCANPGSATCHVTDPADPYHLECLFRLTDSSICMCVEGVISRCTLADGVTPGVRTCQKASFSTPTAPATLWGPCSAL